MPLSIIGAGFGRTGTMSLKLALEALGQGPCYHMFEVFKNPAAPAQWIAAADDPANADWETIFAGYPSTVDWPNATYYQELADAYPDAKVILTERDPEDWYASTQATIFANEIPADTDALFPKMIRKVVYELFDVRMHDKEHVIGIYLAHNARVRETIAPERLLVYEVAHGWKPLCDFLGLPIPAEPMPKVNSREEFRARVAAGGGPPAQRS